MKEQEIKQIISKYEELKNILEEKIYDIWEEESIQGSIDSWELSSEDIKIKWSYSWSWGGYDEGTERYPLSLLWSDHKQYFKNIRDEFERLKVEKADKEKREAEAREREKYEELKRKFENL